MKVEGTFTALVTPFSRDGQHVDYKKLRELTEWQIQAGVNGLVVVRLFPPAIMLCLSYCI